MGTCVLSMYSNQLMLDNKLEAATAKVDIFQFVTPYTLKLVELGTDLKLTVKTKGWDTKPTITWNANSKDYVTGKTGEIKEATAGDSTENILTLPSSLVKNDIAVKLSLAFPNNAIDQTITHDVFELKKSDDVIVQKNN